MERRYLITGGAGNLARQLVPLLAGPGTRVTLFDRVDAGINTDGVHSSVGDIGDAATLRAVMAAERPTHLVHLASMLSGSSEQDRRAAWRVNAAAAFELLELSLEYNVAQVFFPSTSLTYGSAPPDPVPPEWPQWPENLYGATKVAVERLGAYYHARHGLDFRCVRLPLVISRYAPPAATTAFGSHAFIAAVRERAFTFPVTPEATISTIYVKDVVRGIKAVLDAPAETVRERAYNLHSFSLSAGAIAEVLQRRVLGFRPAFAPDPMIMRLARDWPVRFDDSAARRDWHWHPQFDLERMAEDFLRDLAAG